MILLAADTSTSVCSVALAQKTDRLEVIARISIDRSNAHSEKIMTLIERLFTDSGIASRSVDVLALTIGPGSFTGLRIGLSVMKGLSFSLDRPVIGIPTLDAIADKFSWMPCTVWAALTSRKNEFYAAEYRVGANISGNKLFTQTQLADSLKMGDLLISDDPDAFQAGAVGKNISVLDKIHAIPDILHVARLAFQRAEAGRYDDADSLVPEYWQGFRGNV